MFGLVEIIIRDFLGKYGSLALDFLRENSLFIGILVILYGLVLILAQNNLEKIAKKANELENGNLFAKKEPLTFLTAKPPEFWDDLQHVSGFPFISHTTKLLLYRVTQENLCKLLVRYITFRQKTQR
jgi:hypothetical protein